MARILVCWNCGAGLDDVPRPISRQATCGACFEELHCCRMCRHHRADITGECDEDRADPPIKKEVANFCDWYAPRFGAYQPETGSKRDDAKNKLDALFGSDDAHPEDAPEPAGEPTRADEAKAKLDALFGGDDKD